MMDDEVGSLVEKLKPQFVTKWLKTVCEVRFDVMVMCLLPKPVEFARVRPRPRSSKHTIYDKRIKEDIYDESGSIISKMSLSVLYHYITGPVSFIQYYIWIMSG